MWIWIWIRIRIRNTDLNPNTSASLISTYLIVIDSLNITFVGFRLFLIIWQLFSKKETSLLSHEKSKIRTQDHDYLIKRFLKLTQMCRTTINYHL
jgi:hypothetical protein